MLNHYETVFVLTPVLSEMQMKETVDKFEKMLKQNGGEIITREEWGMRRLAYPIQGKTSGFYALLQFDCEPSFIATLETAFCREDSVMRFLTTRLDKYAYEYSLKRTHKLQNAPSQESKAIMEEPVVVAPAFEEMQDITEEENIQTEE